MEGAAPSLRQSPRVTARPRRPPPILSSLYFSLRSARGIACQRNWSELARALRARARVEEDVPPARRVLLSLLLPSPSSRSRVLAWLLKGPEMASGNGRTSGTRDPAPRAGSGENSNPNPDGPLSVLEEARRGRRARAPLLRTSAAATLEGLPPRQRASRLRILLPYCRRGPSRPPPHFDNLISKSLDNWRTNGAHARARAFPRAPSPSPPPPPIDPLPLS